jgi:hypothetical protein
VFQTVKWYHTKELHPLSYSRNAAQSTQAGMHPRSKCKISPRLMEIVGKGYTVDE